MVNNNRNVNPVYPWMRILKKAGVKKMIDSEAVNRIKQSKVKPFKVRKFSLGEEVHVDRDELYSDRVL